ncbi:myb domain-containing protein [Blastocystis sp. ATCC 50177/Nand II]|uniref:Myb domain-containing protein n=1 Tax=Blastocystis sp. subtype 1 (strain ATCC 50177 / NandII) TaxID=478820 RepID=A0A196S494_BLAHN|nr:myb domain-containing protein [Blastocystis sp. ATCC 50177/Nand II]
MNDSDKRYDETSGFEGFQDVELPSRTTGMTTEASSFGLEFSTNSTHEPLLYQNISVPRFSGVDLQAPLLSPSLRREQELNRELVECRKKIQLLEEKTKALFLENESLKNSIRLLSQNARVVDSSKEGEVSKRYWTADEHKRFLEALKLFDEKNKSAISAYVRTKTVSQVRSHMQKYKSRLQRLGEKPMNHTLLRSEVPEPCEPNPGTEEDKGEPPSTSERTELRFVTPLEPCFPSAGDNNNRNYSPFSI